jgi:MoaA/NifB/PqqE/SkfB family radical SAM enzyme
MILQFASRAMKEIDPRLMAKFAYTCGVKGIRSVELHKKRLKRGEYFPPFLFLSITSSCNLRCQGCWVDVEGPTRQMETADVNRVIGEAKRYGNSFFGILGGEPFLHPGLFDILAANPDCYFLVFTNGQPITDEVAARMRQLGNVSPLISIEGSETVSDIRRGRSNVYGKTMAGLANCRRHKLITGVATSVCQTNIEMVSEPWLRQLIAMGVHYAWYYTYRPVGPHPTPELALTPDQLLDVRRQIVRLRSRLPIGILDAYWDDRGSALCPMVTGISHHIGPAGDIEPCPILQFAKESIHDGGSLYDAMTRSQFLSDFRKTSAAATRGCVILERPDLVAEIVARHGARDTTQRQTALAELRMSTPRSSQHSPGHEVPEENWMYRFAKKHWFFGFGAYL